jgi:hypothetical protein
MARGGPWDATLPVLRLTPHALRPAAAILGHLAAGAAFLRLPWATGHGPLAGRDFTGPELARLAANLDVLLPPSAGAAAQLLSLALYLVPTAAVAGALLAATARWSSHPAASLRASALAGAVAGLVALVTAALLLVGPAAGEALSRAPGTGLLIAAVGGLVAAAAWRVDPTPRPPPPR